MNKQTVRDIDVDGRRVLVRVDYNVPIDDDGSIADDFRIEASLPTLKYLLDKNCTLTVVSHLGRPEPGKLKESESLKPTAERLSELLGEAVDFRTDIKDSAPGEHRIVMLENLRGWAGEEENSEEFAKQLAAFGEILVQDAFAVVHREHASLVGVAALLPAVSGLLVEKEVDTIVKAMESPDRPMGAIIGGAKIADKIELLDELNKKADMLIIGGAMANTFLQDENFGGFEIGSSLFEPGEEKTLAKLAEDFKQSGTKIVLPTKDVAVGHGVDDETREEVPTDHVAHQQWILDIGKNSLSEIKKALEPAKTVVWNGPLGYIENSAFAWASIELAKWLAASDKFVVIGGGDTAEFIDEAGLHDSFTHVSTGGGASLTLMSGQSLPGVEALLDKN